MLHAYMAEKSTPDDTEVEPCEVVERAVVDETEAHLRSPTVPRREGFDGGVECCKHTSEGQTTRRWSHVRWVERAVVDETEAHLRSPTVPRREGSNSGVECCKHTSEGQAGEEDRERPSEDHRGLQLAILARPPPLQRSATTTPALYPQHNGRRLKTLQRRGQKHTGEELLYQDWVPFDFVQTQ
ncbi:hypothetical protein CBR_g17790 [Chara braunii]|uniref:Uncharacterized protein n=1 Tax=Chara braunii TaxID=69332 RepID=A0A388KVJ6_CHABU|nr:hypothetical protein CBR_g17790 [Chara braunii]|eukprot:GBG74079.1 hypothetical protein CBR_g17790 [Chara braunii]